MCLQEGRTMFEQELYHSFSISSSRSYFISFAGDVSVCVCTCCCRFLGRTFGAAPGGTVEPLLTAVSSSRPARWA